MTDQPRGSAARFGLSRPIFANDINGAWLVVVIRPDTERPESTARHIDTYKVEASGLPEDPALVPALVNDLRELADDLTSTPSRLTPAKVLHRFPPLTRSTPHGKRQTLRHSFVTASRHLVFSSALMATGRWFSMPDQPERTTSTSAACPSIIAVRPEGRTGVIFACTRPDGHGGEHENLGMGEGWPLVENTTAMPVLVRWSR